MHGLTCQLIPTPNDSKPGRKGPRNRPPRSIGHLGLFFARSDKSGLPNISMRHVGDVGDQCGSGTADRDDDDDDYERLDLSQSTFRRTFSDTVRTHTFERVRIRPLSRLFQPPD